MNQERNPLSADDFERFLERAAHQDPEFAWEYLAARAAWESFHATESGAATERSAAAGVAVRGPRGGA